MSGHSKWANIKERKGSQDKKRSESFTRMAKNIITAVRIGGGVTNPELNTYLRSAIDKAKEVNMPKENIQRLLDSFEARRAQLTSYILEGYGPFGVPLVIETETDNKNRTLSEIKSLLKTYGGSLGETNSVLYQFEKKGEVEFDDVSEDDQLMMIDIGALDFEDNTVMVDPNNTKDFVDRVEKEGKNVVRSEVVLRSTMPVVLKNEAELNKIMDLIVDLEENEDVINVYAGFDYEQKN